MILHRRSNAQNMLSAPPGERSRHRLTVSYGVFLTAVLLLGLLLYFLAFSHMSAAVGAAYLFFLAAIAAGGIGFPRLLSRFCAQPLIDMRTKLEQISEEKELLQAAADQQKPLIVSSYLKQLMSGSASSPDELAYIREYLELPELSSVYNVVYAVTYYNMEEDLSTEEALFPKEATASGPASDYRKFNTLTEDAMKQYFGEPFYCYSPEARTYAILLWGHSGEELLMQAQDTVIKLHDFLLRNYGIWLFAGIGQAAGSPANIWECYEQAMEAAGHSDKNYIFYPYEIMEKSSNAFYYPPELSTKLIHFITAGSKEQVTELFSLIYQENMVERSLPLNLLRYLLQDIRNTLLKARFALPENAGPDTLRLLDRKFEEHLSFKLCEDLALSLCGLFQKENKHQSLSAAIEKYIHTHYQDPSLGLNKISDEFQISESYFSHMFKEKTGVNFSVYLESLRMREAARLVRDGGTNLSELYVEVGYNNPATFRRAFKKVYGVTPSAMRENAAKH